MLRNTVLVSMNVQPVWRWYVGKEQHYPLSVRRPKSKSVWKWLSVLASSFPFPRHYPVMILSLMMMMMMMMMMMTLTDGHINRLCRQNAEFSVVNLTANISDGWSFSLVIVRNFEVTVWTGNPVHWMRVKPV